MARSVSEKMGVREGSRAFFVNATGEVLETLDLPPLDVSSALSGEFDYIHLFVKSREEMGEEFPELKSRLAPTGMLRVSWPKGRRLGADLALPDVISIGYSHGLVESKTISLDARWSAIKFTHPKDGKVYENSYGSLPAG